MIVEGRYTTAAVHQGYIEPHACVASYAADGQCQVWSSSQGQFMIRTYCAKILDLEASDIRVTPAEIGGGFGGKTTVYLEPVALALSRQCGAPVKMVMTRDEVFRATGPTSGAVIEVKLGAKSDGTLIAADVVLKYQAGAFAGLAGGRRFDDRPGLLRRPQLLDRRLRRGDQHAQGRGLSRAGRADLGLRRGERGGRPGAEARHGSDRPAREERGARRRARRPMARPSATSAMSRPSRRSSGIPTTPRRSARTRAAGLAVGFWFNVGGESTAAVNINEDGTAVVISGNPDIGGSRASMAMMAAEVLGLPVDKVRPIVADTGLDRLFRCSPAAAAPPSPPAWP